MAKLDDDAPPLSHGVPQAMALSLYRRMRHVPLVLGWVTYLVMCVVVTRLDTESLLLPTHLVESAVAGSVTALDTWCACITPMILIAALIAPFLLFVLEVPPAMSIALAAMFSLSALPRILVGLWAMPSMPVENYFLIIWQGGLLLIGVGCITSNALIVMRRDTFDCRTCGYPIRATIAAGPKQCPECGAAIPTVTLVQYDEEVEFAVRVEERPMRNAEDTATSSHQEH